MSRISRETQLSPAYIATQLANLSGEVSAVQAKILEMVGDPSIILDADDMDVLAGNVAAIRDVSNGLHLLLGALTARFIAAAKPQKSGKAAA